MPHKSEKIADERSVSDLDRELHIPPGINAIKMKRLIQLLEAG
jgi:hypothetical protein